MADPSIPTEGAVRKIVETAQEAATPNKLDPNVLYGVVVPQGSTVETIKPDERYGEAPKSVRGSYAAMTVESLIAYVNSHATDATTIWVHPTEGRIEAVLNDNARDAAAWGDHRATLTLIRTPEWLFWLNANGNLMPQASFAEHMEDGIKEIVEPDAATMLEIAQSIQAKTKVSFRSATRLSDGEVQMQYDEETEAKAGRKGDLTIPSEFVLAIAPFVGEDPYRVNARLRYRINQGELRIGYRLERPDDIVRDALKQIADRLSKEFGNVYMGSPAGPRR
jgi:uncharacterized protein YfdQ (DUF2303 family)